MKRRLMIVPILLIVVVVLVALMPVFATSYQSVANTYTGIGSVTTGIVAATDNYNLSNDCNTNGQGLIEAQTGISVSDDQIEWVVPSVISVDTQPTTDIYNPCIGGNQDISDANVELVEVDPDGVEITGYIFADNYFELSVNGKLVGRDSIGFVPFNSSVLRFKASYPMTYSFLLVDGETHLGIGMEYDRYNVGDGGMIAYFSDGTITNADWKCETFYIAPLDDPACVVEDADGNRDSSACSVSPKCSTGDPASCRALHYAMPETLMSSDFDDSTWQNASLYKADEVTKNEAYVNFRGMFKDAEFIWTESLKLDNQVVCRLTVDAPKP